ncbi:hypothetical protein JOC95_002928 [Bacillus tianshenii]|uniref:Uncharacterized protein n=1 Tax=Sutcliffiella tianshenii TaxID=1463404 RepID=A0ABS2P269_9BACI|nr:hypothetical protein [Bacillus tianshenii]MBM7621055.1 hypothetical protein [Bacillus tianshenii]
MDTFFDLINIVTNFFSIFSKEVTEEKIEKNIDALHKNDWFRDLLANETYHQMIQHNTDVRYTIGKLNIKKLEKNPADPKFEKAIRRAIRKVEER